LRNVKASGTVPRYFVYSTDSRTVTPRTVTFCDFCQIFEKKTAKNTTKPGNPTGLLQFFDIFGTSPGVTTATCFASHDDLRLAAFFRFFKRSEKMQSMFDNDSFRLFVKNAAIYTASLYSFSLCNFSICSFSPKSNRTYLPSPGRIDGISIVRFF